MGKTSNIKYNRTFRIATIQCNKSYFYKIIHHILVTLNAKEIKATIQLKAEAL